MIPYALPHPTSRQQDTSKYADTTSFVVTAVTTNFVVIVIGLIVTTKLVVMLM